MLTALAEEFSSTAREDLTSQRRQELKQLLLPNVPALLGRKCSISIFQ